MLEGTDAVKVLGLPPVSSGPELSEFEIVSVGVRTGPTATILTFLLEFVNFLAAQEPSSCDLCLDHLAPSLPGFVA
jgi:hypothetical protein